ncbi:MAG: anaerobic ribonucleoside-triphosphate reductase [Proteobacteria bacterium]|jgi:ribonucleoside-triphosphate reductase|nr:anaerobic ribonucleoside-triphosphate reductase [Pseudomonadota bacterium]MBU4228966.1 anaerobic ribonucleoside-triphosphate reductase [Pseudomonadota bacterium]MBU4408481.1 anaerobic ribonucleoside-triphosphate reductase [Pseudomonadota bacterium]MBU4412905.1 anaerobic ribonucleoside-triphosphate reductase [Pseudomonadota bacterium]PKN22088.1 MAG: anaerobic ribonucleoside-triphosphate reductase [Deltaproteobacteria bacterium HGW-Deltaproteobacteria-3]
MPLNAETAQARTQRVVNEDSTDIALFVRSSQDDMTGWNRQRIVDALLRETFIDRGTAEKISRDIEVTIQAGKVKTITGPLIREMVNAKLLEMGLEEARRMHTRLGVPLYDVDQLLVQHNKENANVPHGPEATNLTLAEGIKKEYALLHVFSPDVADAHLSGDLHLHDLGFIDRPYCSGQSLEYIKKFGLNLPHALSMAKPAKHAEVLLAHMVKFAASLQSHFAGAIGWDAINLFYAPYLEELDDNGVKQLAQMMIYEFSQQAVARGGQAIFSDVNIYWEVPKHFVDVPAIGPGGVYTGKTYGEYEKQAQRFAWALFEVYKEGDAAGRPFFFPKPLVHITEKFFKTDGHMDFLHHICEVASVKGNTYFVFDRGDTAKISECCRLSFKLEASDLEDAKQPWKMRYSALQNVTINLPRLAFEAQGDDTKLFALLTEKIQLAAKAHGQKKKFIERLMSLGKGGPLSLLAMDLDGEPYLKLHKCSFLIGMVGLNELIRVHLGQELHDSDESIKFGLKVIAHMNIVCNKLAESLGMKFVLEQTPAESTAFRFAKLDLAHFTTDAEKVVQGNREKGEVYYSNSTLFNVGATMSPIARVEKEGLFHPLIEAGSITHIWLGEAQPDKEALASFVINVFKYTQNDQIAFSPEFTACLACGKTSRGLRETCPYCESKEVDGITRITGYFTKISSWNKGKLGELHDRYRNIDRFNN